MSEPVAVRVRDCGCPGTPHGEEGDIVFLAPTLSLEGGLEAVADIRLAARNATVLKRRWRVTFVRFGAVGWNWLDEDGELLPFDVEVLLADYSIALPVAEAADDLYGESVMRPLVARQKARSPTGPTGGSISPSLKSIPSPQRRSSPATSATKRRAG